MSNNRAPQIVDTALNSPGKIQSGISNEKLPFRVRVIHHEKDLDRVVSIRRTAYSRRIPEFAKSMSAPEDLDTKPGVVILVAESKFDGEVVGTLRIQLNKYQPLALESSAKLPEKYQGACLAEATRLCVSRKQSGRLVRIALFKAMYQYCIQENVQYAVITARKPLDRMYEDILFYDVFPELGEIPMKHVGNIPHRVMALNINKMKEDWWEIDHRYYDFFFETMHRDISTKTPNIVYQKNNRDQHPNVHFLNI